MADVQDVMDTLVAKIAGVVYPNGTSQPPVGGAGVRVYPGWPIAPQLTADIALGIVHVSVFPAGPDRNVTRYAPKQHVMAVHPPTLTLVGSANTVTVGGAMPSPFRPHNMAVLIEGRAFIYPVQALDTLTTIASSLAALIGAVYPGTSSSGPVVSINDADLVFTSGGMQVVDGQSDAIIANVAPVPPSVARVGSTGTVTTEWERQAQLFRITVWAPDCSSRKAVGDAIKVALAQISFLTMVDGFGARILYKGNRLSDEAEKERIYRRDFTYEIEYATTASQEIATVVATAVQFEDMEGGLIASRTY